MDAEMASWKSTGTYVDEVPPCGANIVSGMWIFRVKRPPGPPPVFKVRYVARGFRQRQGVDFFHTFSPTPKMTTLRVLLHVAAQRDYEQHSLDFNTAFLQGSLHEEIWLRRPPGFTGSLPAGTQWSLRRPVYGLLQAPREWHDTLRTTLATLGFAPSTADPSLFLRTDTTLLPFYVLVYVDDLVFATADTEALSHVKSELHKRHTCTDLGELTSYLGLRITRDRAQRTITLTQSHMVQQVLQRFGFTYSSPQSAPLPTGHSLSAPPSDESVEPSGPASGMGLMLGGRARVVLTGHADASWVDDLATQRSSQGYTFSLGSGSVSWRSTRSSSVLSSCCEAEIYAGAMAAQELRWLTYLLTDLGEAPRSPPVMYVDNKAILALCQEHRLEHGTKQIALRYFLARELLQRGQLRLAYVASHANTADFFTKALQPCDHQPCFAFLDWSCELLFSPTLPMGALYDAVIARYSSPATAALGTLLLPYLFPELSALATVADLVTHLRTSDARYRATVPAGFLPTNQPPMFITLYFIVTRLPDSLRSVRDHFLTLDPTSLTVDLLEQLLLAAETSAFAVGAARGTLRPPFFEECSPSPLSPSFASAAAADVSVPEDVGAASTRAKRRNRKGKGGREEVEVVAEVEALVAAVEAAEGVAAVEAEGSVVVDLDLDVEALVVVGASSSSVGARPRRPSSSTCGRYHTKRRCFARLDDAWRAEFGDDVERPHWAQFLQSGVAIFDLDYDVIISAMYALSFSAEGDCYWCVPPDPSIAAAALGASACGTPPGTAPAEALHTFTLDSGASRCFFRDSTTLTPLPAPVLVRLADPSGGPVVARSSTVLPCPAVPSGSLSDLHLPSFSTNLVSTAALQDAMVTTTTPGGQVASCSCRLLSHQTLLWHHRLGHPSLPRLRGMHSRLLVSGLPWSLPPLPPSPTPPCLPCVKGRQRAAPHSSLFPPMTSPLQTLHMDVWGPARISGQGRERYFLLVVDEYTRYRTVFPLRSKGEVFAILVPWIRTVRLQLFERFSQDLPVLRLHSDRGGEFSSDLLRDFCRREGITQSFTLPDSPQQNGIAECRIGLVMEVARTSIIHAAAPHFLWPFAVRYAAHQLNLWPRVSLPETSPTLRWTGKVSDASVFRVWGSRAFVRDTSADKLSTRAIPCVFLGFPPDAPGWQFYHPTSRCVSGHHVAIVSGAAPGAASGGAASGGAEPGGAGSEGAGSGGAEPEGVEPEGVEPGGAESKGAEFGGAEPWGAALSGSPASASPRLSSQQLREWLVRRPHRWSGAPGAGGSGDNGAGGAAVPIGAVGTGGVGGA
ncbi:unnamed protein product [Closterium sp. NIES-53]